MSQIWCSLERWGTQPPFLIIVNIELFIQDRRDYAGILSTLSFLVFPILTYWTSWEMGAGVWTLQGRYRNWICVLLLLSISFWFFFLLLFLKKCKVTFHSFLSAFWMCSYFSSKFLRNPDTKQAVVDLKVWTASLCLRLFHHEGKWQWTEGLFQFGKIFINSLSSLPTVESKGRMFLFWMALPAEMKNHCFLNSHKYSDSFFSVRLLGFHRNA